MEADKDGDGKLSFEEFKDMVSNTVRLSLRFYGEDLKRGTLIAQDIVKQMTLEDLF